MTTPNLEEQLGPTFKAWAEIVLKEFDKKVTMLKIHDGALKNSFKQHIQWHAGDDLPRVKFMFNYYGKFVDMGVGKGVTKELQRNLSSTGATKRVAKRWFSDVFYTQVARLQHIISERLARNMEFYIVRNVNDQKSWQRSDKYQSKP